MANYWNYTNKNGALSPELELNISSSAGDKILGHNILNNHYGKPFIVGGDSKDGMVTKLTFGFS